MRRTLPVLGYHPSAPGASEFVAGRPRASWRQKVVTEIRRHPRLRTIQLMCLAMALWVTGLVMPSCLRRSSVADVRSDLPSSRRGREIAAKRSGAY